VIRSAPVAALALLLTACGGRATPSELPGVRLDYNEALVRSSSQQMLLNMVRLRYLHAPQFFEVAAVTTQSRVTRGGGISLGGNAGQNGTQTAGNPVFTPFFSSGISGSVEISETPTVSYAPLQGEEFANRFITPITGRSMIRLVQTGWRIDRVLSCCVTRINRVAAPVISSHAEGYGGEAFQRLSSLLYDLQMAGALEADVYRRGDEAAVSLSLTPREGEPYFEQAQEVRELLDLDPRLSTYEIVETLPHRMTSGGEAPADPSASTATPPGGGDSIVLRGRSLLGTLLYLSHGVEIAVGDTSARDLGYNGPDGERVEVESPVPESLLQVRRTETLPEDAYIAVRYEGAWYSIADGDLESKQSFLLIEVLFSLLSNGDASAAPLFTLPVGG
jgi:hypothetical protein